MIYIHKWSHFVVFQAPGEFQECGDYIQVESRVWKV